MSSAGQEKAVLLIPSQDAEVHPERALRLAGRSTLRHNAMPNPPSGAWVEPDESPAAEAKGFTKDQLKKLVQGPDPRHLQTRELDGKRLTYIEGWYAIAQANAIFGHAGWDREMVHFERVMERTRSDATVICGYLARVRIRVRAGSTEVIREGTGWGSASASTATVANERALKSAETDATKRALSTFGASFGLSLYDKDHVFASRPSFALFTPDGRTLDDNLSPEGFSTGLRQLIELCRTRQDVDRLSRHNASSLAELRIKVHQLRNGQGTHFADLLLRLMQRRREALAPEHLSPTDAVGTESCQDGGLHRDQNPSPAHVGPGESFRKYTGQSQRRRELHPFPSRRETSTSRSPSHQIIPATGPSPALLKAEPPAETPAPLKSSLSAGVTASTDPAVPDPAPVPEKGKERSEEISRDGAGTEKTSLAEAPASTSVAKAELATPVRWPVDAAFHPKGAHAIDATNGSVANPNRISAQPSALRPSTIGGGLRIDKSKLWLALERRIRDKMHLKRVGELPCLICSRQPSHAHHLRFAQRRGLSQKVSDEYVVPLCALHHGDLHRSSSEQDWWKRQKIDPMLLANELWVKHH